MGGQINTGHKNRPSIFCFNRTHTRTHASAHNAVQALQAVLAPPGVLQQPLVLLQVAPPQLLVPLLHQQALRPGSRRLKEGTAYRGSRGNTRHARAALKYPWTGGHSITHYKRRDEECPHGTRGKDFRVEHQTGFFGWCVWCGNCSRNLVFYFSWLCRHNTKYSRTSTANQKRKQATEDMKTFLLGT